MSAKHRTRRGRRSAARLALAACGRSQVVEERGVIDVVLLKQGEQFIDERCHGRVLDVATQVEAWHAYRPTRRPRTSAKPRESIASSTARLVVGEEREEVSANRARFRGHRRLVAVGVTPGVVDQAEDRGPVVSLHEGLAVVDGLAGDRPCCRCSSPRGRTPTSIHWATSDAWTAITASNSAR